LWSRTRRDGTIFAACAWLVVPLLPVLNIAVFYRDDFVHDRYLYLPAVGVAIFCSSAARGVWGVTPSSPRRLFSLASMTLLIGSLAGLTLTESMPWRDNLSLYSRAAQNSTNSMARMNLATEYARLGRFEDAKELLEPVVHERPDYWLANYNLGYVDYRMKDLESAERLLDRAIAQNPGESDAYLYRGLVSFRKQRTEEAISFLRRAIALNPRGENYHFALGMLLARQNPEAAKMELREELKYHPQSGLVKMQLDGLDRAKPAATTGPQDNTRGNGED
jgi:tetratricopeptide (TPR) repeat protein